MAPEERLENVIPEDGLGELKDLATQLVIDSARLEGSIADKTAQGLGEQLRLLNAYHSNRIEGHKTGILDIRKALEGHYRPESHDRYNQELSAAHVETEQQMMRLLKEEGRDPFAPEFLPELHRLFYGKLPARHQFCHSDGGFTEYRVMPGELRDRPVSVDGVHQLGPGPEQVSELFQKILRLYSPENKHGDERLIAVLSAHHRLTWLHPFRDGNGRMMRLHTTAAMAHIGINRKNLWSLSRGFSWKREILFQYQMNLQDADNFTDESLSDFVRFSLEQGLDQIGFIARLLNVTDMENRIERYFRDKLPPMARMSDHGASLTSTLKNPNLVRLMCGLFRSGEMPRGEAYAILGVQRKRGGELLRPLFEKGLIQSPSERGPLLFGFPETAMPDYFPYLYKPSLMVNVDGPMEGLVVRDGNEARLAREDGTLLSLGPWRESLAHLQGRRATPQEVWELVQQIEIEG